jgi:hypothetical protein
MCYRLVIIPSFPVTFFSPVRTSLHLPVIYGFDKRTFTALSIYATFGQNTLHHANLTSVAVAELYHCHSIELYNSPTAQHALQQTEQAELGYVSDI